MAYDAISYLNDKHMKCFSVVFYGEGGQASKKGDESRERGVKIKWEIERESEQEKERREGGDNETETRVRRWAEG